MASLYDIPKRHYSDGAGIYSVCSAHPVVLEAAARHAVMDDSLLLVEATSNQVDQYGGYTGMKPAEFRAWATRLVERFGLAVDRLVLGGDHLGPNPWRREPASEALAKAGELVRQFAAAGFHKIHLDCSMALGGDAGPAPSQELVAERAASLCRIAEEAAAAAGHPAPVYVIGTEVPIPGGVDHELDDSLQPTAAADAAVTLEAHRAAFKAAGLDAVWPRIIAMVVQPGVEFGNYSVVHYDREKAADLSSFIAKQDGLVFEAHSTDYQLESGLRALVRDHFAILKVGPWLTYAYREALFGLNDIARELGQPADLRTVMDGRMLANPGYWQGHYHGTPEEQRLARMFSYSDRARYYWPDAEIDAAVTRLLDGLDNVDIPLPLLGQYLPHQYDAVQEKRIANRPRDLVMDAVMRVVGIFARAAGVSGSKPA